MSRAPKNPERVWFAPAVLAAALVALACGYGCYSRQVRQHGIAALSESAREELASLAVPARATAKLERAWLSEGAASNEYLIASNVPMPCEGVSSDPAVVEAFAASREPDPALRTERLEAIADEAPDNMLVALIHGTQLIGTGEYARAEQILARTLNRTNDDERIIESAKAQGSTLDLDDHRVSTVIHLHHALGVARLARASGTPPWVSLKNVIGSVKTLSRRRIAGATRDQAVWSRLPIVAPGCTGITDTTLSTYDLYNNLIVAYMKGNFAGAELEREKEFSRPRTSEASPLRALLNAEVKKTAEAEWRNESQLWALSNVEQVIDWRLPAVPDDARLAFNSVQVIDFWTKGEERGLGLLRDRLIEQMFRRRNVAPDQRSAFAKGALRMLATSNIDRASIANDAALVREWLQPQDARALDDFLAADAARNALPRWLVAREEDQEPPHAKLGPRAEAWYAAALTDYAAAAARWAAGRPAAEQGDAIVAIRRMLASSAAPAELVALENGRGWRERLWLRLAATSWFWAAMAALLAVVVWFVLVWILVHIRERRLLHTSLYNVEYEMLSRGDPRKGRAR